jgi:hypothetical protein
MSSTWPRVRPAPTKTSPGPYSQMSKHWKVRRICSACICLLCGAAQSCWRLGQSKRPTELSNAPPNVYCLPLSLRRALPPPTSSPTKKTSPTIQRASTPSNPPSRLSLSLSLSLSPPSTYSLKSPPSLLNAIDRHINRACIIVAGYCGGGTLTSRLIDQALSSECPLSRSAALTAFATANPGSNKALSLLLRALATDEDPSVRLSAAASMPSCLPPLPPSSSPSSSPLSRPPHLDVLAALGCAIRTDEDSSVRSAAHASFYRFPKPYTLHPQH